MPHFCADDEVNVVRCDLVEPRMTLVSKIVPTSDEVRVYAFGHVFRDAIARGRKVERQGPHCRPGYEDLNILSVKGFSAQY